MSQIKIICFLFLVFIGAAACSSTSGCGGESLCQQKNTKILNAITELNKIGENISCTGEVSDVKDRVEAVVNKFDTAQEIAILAAMARALQNYENDEVPTCFNSRSDQAFDHAFWICLRRLSKSSDDKSKEYLKRLEASSNLNSMEKLFFDETLTQ